MIGFQNVDTFAVTDVIDGEPCAIAIFNIYSQGVPEARSSSYSQADVFIVCFSTVNEESFHNAKIQVNLYKLVRVS